MGIRTKPRSGSLESYMDAYAERWDFQGTVRVSHRGKVLLRKGYGLSVAEHAIPNRPETKFGIASISKGFTAMAILQLMERELLGLEDLVEQHLPDYPNGSKITIQQLLTHTAGVPDFFELSEFWTKHQRLPHSLEEVIGIFKDRPLTSEPGTRFSYSNTGYTLLAAIIEKCAGLS